jgi:hypothetical protein
MLDLQNTQFLTKEQIQSKAGSVFTTHGSQNTSEKYTHIPTAKVVEDMELLGWGVVDAKEVKARKGIGFQKHLLVFRNNDLQITSENGDMVWPQILLTNSHDGKNAFTFTAGLFRLICENGMVISTQQFEKMKIRHMGYSFEELQATIRSMVEKLPLTVEALNKFKSVELGQEQALEFAKKAITTRFTEQEIENVNIDFEELLRPTRKEDEGQDLWSVYNVVQEKIIHGMFNYSSGVKVRKARKIKNFEQDMKINEQLFEMAMEYAHA